MGFSIAQAALIGVSVAIVAIILFYIFKSIGNIFSKVKSEVCNAVENNIKPALEEKRQNLKEEKLLKLINLKKNEIITEEEYAKRMKK